MTRPSQLWRVTDRVSFDALARSRRRGRSGPVRCTWLPPDPGAPASPPRTAFSVGRAAGNAVARNRIRRRLRAALRDLAAADALPAGTYLLGGSAELAQLDWDVLVTHVEEAVRAATASLPPPGSAG